MGGAAGSWKNRNYNTYEKIPKSKNYMGLYGWQARFWAISLDFSAAPGNHLQSQTCYICLLYPPPPRTTTTQCAYDAVYLMFVCTSSVPFSTRVSPPFLPWMALTSLWMRIKRAFHFQSNDVNPSPPLPGMVHKSANLCPTDTVFKIQTNNDKECILQESEKGQISYWSIHTCTRIMLSIDWLIVNHAQKPENGPISDLFNLTQNTFCLYCLILT